VNAVELGTYGGVAKRAFKLKGEDVTAGDPVTAEMLDGLSPRHVRALEGSGLVTYYNKAAGEATKKVVPPKPKKRSK